MAHIQINFGDNNSEDEVLNTRSHPNLPTEIRGKAIWVKKDPKEQSHYSVYFEDEKSHVLVEFINGDWYIIHWEEDLWWVSKNDRIKNTQERGLGTRSRPYISSLDQQRIELAGIFSETDSVAPSTSVQTLEDLPTIDVEEERQFQLAAAKLNQLSLNDPIPEQGSQFGYDPLLDYAALTPEQWDLPGAEGTFETIFKHPDEAVLEHPDEDTLMSQTHIQASWTFTTTSSSGGTSAPTPSQGMIQGGGMSVGTSRSVLQGGVAVGTTGSV